jgi:hypothetical protein
MSAVRIPDTLARPCRHRAPSLDGSVGDQLTQGAPLANGGNGKRAMVRTPLGNGANGKCTMVRAPLTNGGNGKCTRVGAPLANADISHAATDAHAGPGDAFAGREELFRTAR